MMKQKPRAGLGASSILLIIVVLCLTAFGTLTWMTALTDASMTERIIAAEQAYYQADADAQKALCALDTALHLGEAAPAGWTETDGAYVQSFPVKGDMVIEVAVSWNGSGLEIERYRTRNEGEWNTSVHGLVW